MYVCMYVYIVVSYVSVRVRRRSKHTLHYKLGGEEWRVVPHLVFVQQRTGKAVSKTPVYSPVGRSLSALDARRQ